QQALRSVGVRHRAWQRAVMLEDGRVLPPDLGDDGLFPGGLEREFLGGERVRPGPGGAGDGAGVIDEVDLHGPPEGRERVAPEGVVYGRRGFELLEADLAVFGLLGADAGAGGALYGLAECAGGLGGERSGVAD